MPCDFDAFVADVDYPIYVVTTAHGEQRAGCLVGFTTQVTIDPPRLLVCLSVNNHTYRIAKDAMALAVHLLRPHQRHLAELFASHTGDEVDKFARCRWEPGPSGIPVLTDCPRCLIGRIRDRIGFGDHVGFVLDPVSVRAGDGGPTLTFQDVVDLSPGHPA